MVPGWVIGMTMTPLSPRVRVLEAAKDAVARRMRADADLLATAADWALLHPVSEAEDAAGWCFGEDLIPLAGEGAPWVAEFAPAELAAVLGWKTETVAELMGDALELAARLPRVYRDVQELRLSVSLGRYLAEQTRDLSMDGARRVDKMLCGGGKLTRPFIRRVVDEVRLYEDPTAPPPTNRTRWPRVGWRSVPDAPRPPSNWSVTWMWPMGSRSTRPCPGSPRCWGSWVMVRGSRCAGLGRSGSWPTPRPPWPC